MVQTRSAHAEKARHIVSYQSAATGETLFYERFHIYEDDGEVLFVQQRKNERGQFVPYTSEEEDEGSQDKSDEKHDRDYKDEDSAPEMDEDDGFVAPEEMKRASRRRKAVIKQSVTADNRDQQGSPTKVGQKEPVRSRRRPARAAERTRIGGNEDKGDYDDSVYPAFEPNEGFERIPSLVTDLEAASLNCESRKRSLLRNIRLADLSEVSGLVAHTTEKEAYDFVRPGKVVAGRWVLEPRPILFRPTNPEFQKYVNIEP
ncbi:hypothetical protein E4T39_06962 [Aureobasidium subglaciale]|nr:hypothetical protein E4T39_06962 [Aureobasidium subglaciale]